MNVQFGLNIVTLVMCIITLAMATAALMPQIKMGLVILRDGLLWSLLLGIVCFVGFIGWARLHEVRLERASQRTMDDLQTFQAPEMSANSVASNTNASGETTVAAQFSTAPTVEARRSLPSLLNYSAARTATRVPADRYVPRVYHAPVREASSHMIRPNRSTPLLADRWQRATNTNLKPVYYEGRYAPQR